MFLLTFPWICVSKVFLNFSVCELASQYLPILSIYHTEPNHQGNDITLNIQGHFDFGRNKVGLNKLNQILYCYNLMHLIL
ncbi:MAG: hypothetical protein UZ14_CFX002002244 [Chloroflexi bacterium OLB14]|nr:MAG: hypothetical protein UZ14_CFX002002244 [Chloroflexi bacterium OLB14]